MFDNALDLFDNMRILHGVMSNKTDRTNKERRMAFRLEEEKAQALDQLLPKRGDVSRLLRDLIDRWLRRQRKAA